MDTSTLDERSRLGLGGHLFESLGREVPVIGVAKSRFQNAPYQTIFRGKSIRPLYITAAGIPLKTAANRVLSMAGEYRMPDLLRHLDKLTKRDKS
jgi:deoxyribonuclease V